MQTKLPVQRDRIRHLKNLDCWPQIKYFLSNLYAVFDTLTHAMYSELESTKLTYFINVCLTKNPTTPDLRL